MPEGWEDRLDELTHFMRWGPDVVEGMTFTESVRRLERARRMRQQMGA